MKKDWYYAKNDEVSEGLSATELMEHLEKGDISVDTLVCREGLEKWEPLKDCYLLKLNAAKPNIKPLPNVIQLNDTATKPLEDTQWIQSIGSRRDLMKLSEVLARSARNNIETRDKLMDAGVSSQQIYLMDLSTPCPDCDSKDGKFNCPFGLIKKDGQSRIAFRCEKDPEFCSVKQIETPESTPDWEWG